MNEQLKWWTAPPIPKLEVPPPCMAKIVLNGANFYCERDRDHNGSHSLDRTAERDATGFYLHWWGASS